MPAWQQPCASARDAFCRRTLAWLAIPASCTHGYPTWEQRANGHERPAGRDRAGTRDTPHDSHPHPRECGSPELSLLEETNEFPHLAVVIGGAVLGIPDQFVYEVAQVQDKAEPVLLSSVLIFEDHSSIRVLRSEVCVLTTDEREAHWPGIIVGRRGDGAADAAAVTLRIGKAIPIDLGRLQSSDQHTTGPIRRRRNRDFLSCDHMLERLVERHFDGQLFGRLRLRCPPGPQQYAVAVGIAGGYTFREKLATLMPENLRG